MSQNSMITFTLVQREIMRRADVDFRQGTSDVILIRPLRYWSDLNREDVKQCAFVSIEFWELAI